MIETPRWLELAIAEGLAGVAEVPGPGSNPRVLEYHATTTLKATDDAVPWCAAGACWCLERAGWQSPRSARARDFLTWGTALAMPVYGCLVVLARGPQPWAPADVTEAPGHVGFHLARPAAGELLLYGANQADRWCARSYPTGAVLGYRLPNTRNGGDP